MIRTIYSVECFDSNCNLTIRQFFRNRRAAERYAKTCKWQYVYVNRVPKASMAYVNPDYIRG